MTTDHAERITKLITLAYTDKQRGSIKRLQSQTGLSYGRIYRRTQSLGLLTDVHKRQPAWTETELAILEKNAHNNPVNIAKLLVDKGFARRTPTAIQVKMHRIGLEAGQSRIDAGIYSCHEAARCMGVANHVIAKYIERGWLTAKRDEHLQNQQWQITEKALRELMINHTAAIDFKKIDKYWLVECLTGGTGAKA